MNNLNWPLLFLAKNGWMKLDESLPSTLISIFVGHAWWGTCLHEKLFEMHEMWGAPSCMQTCYYMHRKTCTKISNSWTPEFVSFSFQANNILTTFMIHLHQTPDNETNYSQKMNLKIMFLIFIVNFFWYEYLTKQKKY